MALAETAQLAVQLNLAGNFGAGIAKAEGQLGGLNRAASGVGTSTGRLSGALGKVEGAAGRFGGALSHAGGQLKSLVTGPLGILGLTGGLLGLGGAIESSLSKASNFSLSLERLTGLTGESAQSMGELILVAQKFGVESDRLAQIVGFTEKRLGLLQNTSAAAAKGGISLSKAQEEVTKAHEKLSVATQKLSEIEAKGKSSASALTAAHNRVADADRALTKAQNDLAHASSPVAASLNKLQELGKQYGVVLTDSRGKALDFSTVLNHVADYYSSNATAANKAALASQVFGRGFAVMIPILQLGSKGINNAKQAVADLGLSLGTDTQGALAAYKTALRGVGEAIDVLQISIGLALAPAITELANNITLFLEHGGAKQIVGFFKQGAQFASDMGHVFETSVIPVFGQITAAWNAIPADIKTLLVTGFIANKAVKWTFGIDLVGGALTVGKDLAKGFIAGLGKSLAIDAAEGTAKGLAVAGLGKLFVQPVFVTNWALMGGGGGLLGATAGAAEGGLAGLAAGGGLGGLVATVVPLVLPLVITGAVVAAIFALTPSGATIPHDPATRPVGGRAPNWTPQNPLPVSDTAAKNAAEASRQLDAAKTNAFSDQSTAMVNAFNQTAGFLRSQRERPDTARIDFSRLGPILRSSLDPLIATLRASKGEENIRRAADALAAAVKAQQGRGTLTAGTAGLGVKELKDSLVALQAKQAAALKAGNTALAAALGKDIKAVERKLPERAFVAKELATEERILRSTEKSGDKLRDLTGIQRALQQHGDTKAAAIVSRAIADMKNRLARTTAQAGEVAAAAIRHKKQLVDVNVQNTISVSTTVSARQVRTAEVVVQRYGTNRIGWT